MVNSPVFNLIPVLDGVVAVICIPCEKKTIQIQMVFNKKKKFKRLFPTTVYPYPLLRAQPI